MGGEILRVTPENLHLGAKTIDGDATKAAGLTVPDPSAATAALPGTVTAGVLTDGHDAAKAALEKASGRYTTMGTLIDNVATAFAEADSSLVGSRMSVAVGNGMTTMGDMSAPPKPSTTSQPVLV
ncbi:MAG: hypothetical protein WAV90_06390 [Gordonia amarae]